MEARLNQSAQGRSTMVISYLTLRKAIGILGFSFPVVLVIGSMIGEGCEEIQASISNYYYTAMRDIFVGILCAVALFLFSYRGYDSRDNIAGSLGCIFALGIAFFPTTPDQPLQPCNMPSIALNPLSGSLHIISAALFFMVLAYFCIFLFTMTHGKKTPQKRIRNRVYRTCGYIILGCILVIAIYFMLPSGLSGPLLHLKPVFWLETMALWAFGLSWLVKGESLLKDS